MQAPSHARSHLLLGTATMTIGSSSSPVYTRKMMGIQSLRVQCHSTLTGTAGFTINTSTVKHDTDKKKVLLVLGATATGKSKLSIDLATHLGGEVINADKIQVYRGLDIASNKVPEDDRRGVPHHLLGFMDPDDDYTTEDFSNHVHMAMDHIIGNGHIPIIAGGSNRYVESLVEEPSFDFNANFDTCFIWMDVALPVLYKRAAKRVDEMIDGGLVDEVREMFTPGIDYGRGIWRTIGVAELEPFFQAERDMADEATKKMLLDIATEEIKQNTYKLAENQVAKIKRLRDELGWKLHRIDATCVYGEDGAVSMEAWKYEVSKPALEICYDFLRRY